MPIFTAESLTKAGYDIFLAAGFTEEESRTVSKSLVESNLLGHDSHGIIRIPQYIQSLEKLGINIGADISVIKETPGTAALDGNWGLGQAMARKAMNIAIEKARKTSIASVTLYQSQHVGRLGEYSEIAAKEGFIGIIMTNNHGAGQAVAPWGGRERRLAPTPISICTPSGTEILVLMDFTASVSAEGKVRVAKNRGKTLPEGYIIDAEGNPSTDPNDLYGPPPGSLLPFGGVVGYKGYALGFMIEMLAGILSGAGPSQREKVRFGNAAFMIVLDIEAFISRDVFDRQLSEFIKHVKSSAKAPGFEEILFPGEIEHRARQRRLRDGIEVGEETWSQIVATAESLGVKIETP